MLSSTLAAAAETASPFDLSNTDTTILAPASNQVIGHGRYRLTHVNGVDLIKGENRYLNGEYDSEVQRVRRVDPSAPPLLIDYQHSFFNADGTPQYMESLNAATGQASCKVVGPSPDFREAKIDVPPDTYAGATQLALLVGRLRQGQQEITFHSYNCLPAPRIVAVKATKPVSTIGWPMYPGNLVQMKMEPDLGWLNVIAAPFIPKVYAWFDPGDNFTYVGGEFDRYYRGRHVLVVRARDDDKVTQSAVSSSPSP